MTGRDTSPSSRSPRTPLLSTLLGAGAVSGERWGIELAESFGDAGEEHRRVREAAGVIDGSWRGAIAVRPEPGATPGAPRDLLARILSSDVKALEPGRGQPSTLLTPKGKLIGSFELYRTGPAEFLLLFREPGVSWEGRAPSPLDSLRKYAGLEGVEVEAREAGIVAVQGPRAAEVLERALHLRDLPGAPWLRAEADSPAGRVAVRRAGDTPEGGFEVEAAPERLAEAWAFLAGAARGAGGGPTGEAAAEVLRIEAGVPRWGAEVDASRFPVECGLEDAVSYSKGCYIGQEIMARMRTYGHANRRLLALLFDGAPRIAPGAALRMGGEEAGRVTSSAISPRTGRAVALALVGRRAWEPGTAVEVEDAGPAVTAEIPPVKVERQTG